MANVIGIFTKKALMQKNKTKRIFKIQFILHLNFRLEMSFLLKKSKLYNVTTKDSFPESNFFVKQVVGSF
ncbi:hypothetical protein EMA8858_01184 [Emticicia aquatica]|jgi:hypothetical protein|uniref:Uncharacterized protein n=1 Tax=Emticicia aquatica TaxID=1681835 RepID=A0ABM9AMP7_9BACT|nr:hypothetical protein EMA8858_01184 [Emticicia aquatica]